MVNKFQLYSIIFPLSLLQSLVTGYGLDAAAASAGVENVHDGFIGLTACGFDVANHDDIATVAGSLANGVPHRLAIFASCAWYLP